MKAEHKIEKDGSITISFNFKTEGSMFQQEEQIAQVLAEAGKIATAFPCWRRVLKRAISTGSETISATPRWPLVLHLIILIRYYYYHYA